MYSLLYSPQSSFENLSERRRREQQPLSSYASAAGASIVSCAEGALGVWGRSPHIVDERASPIYHQFMTKRLRDLGCECTRLGFVDFFVIVTDVN